MSKKIPAHDIICETLAKYQLSFTNKVYTEENDDHDILMDVFGVTPELKRQNRQYWGRELGMCWQIVISQLFAAARNDYAKGYVDGADELCDLMAGEDAIDTKYRIGSGDSGTLKKLKKYGVELRKLGYTPILLIVREDNLPSAITACKVGKWDVLTGQASFDYIYEKTGADFQAFLKECSNSFAINR